VTNWLTRPLFSLSAKWPRMFLAAVILSAVLLFISPTIYTLGWHVLHGNAVETRGHRIIVPLRWTADADDPTGVSMTRLPATVIHGVRLGAWISIGPYFPPPHENPMDVFSSWEHVYWNLALPGAAITGPIRIGSGVHEFVCMESSYPQAPQRETASCLMLQGTWAADFLGDKNDSKTFFDLLQKFD